MKLLASEWRELRNLYELYENDFRNRFLSIRNVFKFIGRQQRGEYVAVLSPCGASSSEETFNVNKESSDSERI